MDFFEAGKIVNTQGLKGEVRLLPMTDEPEKFKTLKRIFLFLGDQQEEYFIEQARMHKHFIILKLRGIDDANSAHTLRGAVVKIPREEAVPLGEDEYYLRDIYDMAVLDETGVSLGIVADIIFTGANDVYVIKRPGKKDLLIPAIKQCILKVDVNKKEMTVKLLEGLDIQ